MLGIFLLTHSLTFVPGPHTASHSSPSHTASYSSPHTLTSMAAFFAKAPTGWRWSYKMITPTITLRQNTAVSSLSNQDEYSLQCVCNVRVCMCDVGICEGVHV